MSIKEKIIDILVTEGCSIINICGDVDNNIVKLVGEVYDTYCSGNNVFISGMGKCSFVAQKLVATYCSLGIPTFYLNCSAALHGDVGAFRSGDLLILFSKSGKTREIIELASVAKDFSVTVVGITCYKSTLYNISNYSVVVPINSEVDSFNLAPTSSTAVFMALGDAVGVVVSGMLGFTKEDFNKRHPK